MLVQESGDACRQRAVTATGRAHPNDPTLDELVVLVVVWNP